LIYLRAINLLPIFFSLSYFPPRIPIFQPRQERKGGGGGDEYYHVALPRASPSQKKANRASKADTLPATFLRNG
jgi:hypothetical protein